ncbi:LOW QUALITY PROTEIN: DNA repair protein RecN, partial [Streptomyces himastatinicus ATCC 53653]
ADTCPGCHRRCRGRAVTRLHRGNRRDRRGQDHGRHQSRTAARRPRRRRPGADRRQGGGRRGPDHGRRPLGRRRTGRGGGCRTRRRGAADQSYPLGRRAVPRSCGRPVRAGGAARRAGRRPGGRPRPDRPAGPDAARPAAQALDRYAGAAVVGSLEKYAGAYRRLRAVAAELDELTTRAREREQEADLLRFGLEEVAAAEPRAGEDDELAAEAERLGHAEALASAAALAHAALAGNPEDLEAVDAATLVGGAHRALEAVRSHDPALAGLADRIGEVGILLSDVAGELAGYADDLDADPLRLAAVEERRAALAQLTRKYGENISDVLTWAEQGAARLAELDGDDDRIGELTAERDALRADLGGLAQALTDARTEAAARFAEAVTEELASLAMPHARVTFAIRQTEAADEASGVEVGGRAVAYGPHGADEVELLLAPHPGAPPRPIAKGASGGELSRVMLAVEVVFAGSDPVPTYLFDEVDAGVGGKAAVEVGRRLARLARSAQVVVVTHLPQVAAFADRHLVVEKTNDGAVTRSGVKAMEGEDRVRELSRMLAGQEDSELARAHAEELLEAARTGR